MTLKELLPEVEQLSQDELLILLEIVTRALRAALQQPELPGGDQRPSSLERVLGMLAPGEIPPFESLQGVLRPEGAMPSDEDLRDDYINYLIEKYS